MGGHEEITIDDVMDLAQDFAELCQAYDESRDTYDF